MEITDYLAKHAARLPNARLYPSLCAAASRVAQYSLPLNRWQRLGYRTAERNPCSQAFDGGIWGPRTAESDNVHAAIGISPRCQPSQRALDRWGSRSLHQQSATALFCHNLLMCGRYRLSRRKQIVEEYFDAVSREEEWTPRYNIAPTQPVPVIRQNPTEPRRELSLVRWGLIPSWAKDPSGAARMINARAETAATKPAFRDALRFRRCMIAAVAV